MGYPFFPQGKARGCPRRLVTEITRLGAFCERAMPIARHLETYPHRAASSLHECYQSTEIALMWCGVGEPRNQYAVGHHAWHKALGSLRLTAEDPNFWQIVEGVSQKRIP